MSKPSASTKPAAPKKKAPSKKPAATKPTKVAASKRPATKKVAKKPSRLRLSPMVLLIGLAGLAVTLLLVSASANQRTLNQLAQATSSGDVAADQHFLGDQLKPVILSITQLQAGETQNELQVVDAATPLASIKKIRTEIQEGQIRSAAQALKALKSQVAGWQTTFNQQLAVKVAQKKAAALALSLLPAKLPPGSANIPILIYHDPPSDFQQQLLYLKAHNYTTITPDELVGGLEKQITLPAKPVLITFDDGLETQMGAFDLLQQYHMLATFYIIDGGQDSDYHIGANRIVPDPQGGPDYLTWDQIRMLDASGIITIGSHTIDHLDLATQTSDVQEYEIAQGKAQLEAQIGHSVDSFAYPYGSYTSATINLVQQAGFTSAVTTNPGTVQSVNGLLTLYRIRTVYNLP